MAELEKCDLCLVVSMSVVHVICVSGQFMGHVTWPVYVYRSCDLSILQIIDHLYHGQFVVCVNSILWSVYRSCDFCVMVSSQIRLTLDNPKVSLSSFHLRFSLKGNLVTL